MATSESDPNLTEQDLHQIPALQTIAVREGVALEPLGDQDASDFLSTLEADPQIKDRVTLAARVHSAEDFRKEVESYQADPGRMRYAVKESGKFVGLVNFARDIGWFDNKFKPNSYLIGYFLHPEARGKGIVTDSIKELMRAADSSLQVESYFAFCEDSNRDSVAILERLGFEPTNETYAEPQNGWTERKYEYQKKVKNV
jgi:RimJ/RimL family protein N-acetyltransferase